MRSRKVYAKYVLAALGLMEEQLLACYVQQAIFRQPGRVRVRRPLPGTILWLDPRNLLSVLQARCRVKVQEAAQHVMRVSFRTPDHTNA